MSVTVAAKLIGATAAIAVLRDLEFAARRRVVQAATRAASAVVVAEVRQEAPVGQTGQLRKQLKASLKFARSIGTVIATIRSKATKSQRTKKTTAWYTRLVVGGTKPHDIHTSLAFALNTPHGFFRHVRHPGARPNPFMDRAAAASFSRAVDAFTAKFKEAMDKEIQKARRGAT